MKFCKKRQVVILIGTVALCCLCSCQPKRHRIGDRSQVTADVEPLLQACLNICSEPGELRGRTREACANACYELRRDFPFLDKGYSSYEQCAKDMDNLDLNRDLIISGYQAKCPEIYETSLQRQTCKDAAKAFYTAATVEKVCRPGGASANSGIKQVSGPGETPAPAQPFGPILYDTPKYNEGKFKAVRPVPALAPAAQKVQESKKQQPAPKSVSAQQTRKPESPRKDSLVPRIVLDPSQKATPAIQKPAAQSEPAVPGIRYPEPGEANKVAPATPAKTGKPAPNREYVPVVTPGAQSYRPHAPQNTPQAPAAPSKSLGTPKAPVPFQPPAASQQSSAPPISTTPQPSAEPPPSASTQ